MKYIKQAALFGAGLVITACAQAPEPPQNTFSFVGKITVVDGKQAEFRALMQEAFKGMTECISCKVMADIKEPNVVWVAETWPSKAAHDAVLDAPDLQEIFAKGRPMITNMQRMAESGH